MIRNPSGRAAQRARAVAESVCVSVIVAAELRYGCARKGSPRLLRKVEEFRLEVPVLPFDVRLTMSMVTFEPNWRRPAALWDRTIC